MRKRRVPSSAREASYKTLRHRSSGLIPSKHFVGLSLSGGKADKTSFALIEYFPTQKKIFLSTLVEQIQNSDGVPADMQIERLIESTPQKPQSIAVDAPLTLPKSFEKPCRCLSYDKCKEPEIKWMLKHYQKKNFGKKPFRYMTPYTERCVELYLESELEEKFSLHHALGSNRAPITARVRFLKARLKKQKFIEVVPKISFWRLGLYLDLPKSKLRLHRHWDGGAESRRLFLEELIKRDLAFIYEQDLKILVEDQYAFDAFLCGLTGVMASKRQTESRPAGFPKAEGWIEFPKLHLNWP